MSQEVFIKSFLQKSIPAQIRQLITYHLRILGILDDTRLWVGVP
jgi:hypothetical protein